MTVVTDSRVTNEHNVNPLLTFISRTFLGSPQREGKQ